MDALFKKLNFKSQEKAVILAAPDTFKPHMEAMDGHTLISEHLDEPGEIEFALVFGRTKAEMEAEVLPLLPKLGSDAVFWIAYPKVSSKKYTTDYNRDSGWDLLGEWGMEPVRQVAIDQDWSALRFRKVENIPRLKRKFGLLSEKKKP